MIKNNDMEFNLIKLNAQLDNNLATLKEIGQYYPDRKLSIAYTELQGATLWIASKIDENKKIEPIQPSEN